MSERICIVPRVHGIGGMVSFLHKFSTAVENLGITVSNDLADGPYNAILVIGGSRQLLSLWRSKQRIVQRLDGINWIHRRRPVSLRHSLRSEYGNLVLSLIRRYVAARIIYQSDFSCRWWNDWFGSLEKPSVTIHNGVDLSIYSPRDPQPPSDRYRLLVVEGSMSGGYEGGLANAIRLAEAVGPLVSRPVELMVVGDVSAALRHEWQGRTNVPLVWAGKVAREAIPALDRGAHALFSADVHPACPNSVIEALACGLPVLAYDTGSLSELVTPESGCVAPYGSDSWKLETPRVEELARGTVRVLENQPAFRAAARRRAESAFGIDSMAKRYLDVLLG